MMMSFRDRKTLKEARELVHASRKLLRINRDIMVPASITEIQTATDRLTETIARRDVPAVPPHVKSIETLLEKYLPAPRPAGIRENVEVLLVAALVAMAVRTFFLQPFKIPTGSMQPTLYGIHYETDCPSLRSLPGKLVDLALFGTTTEGGRCKVKGDFIFVDKLSYHFRKPQPGDVVVFETTHIPELTRQARGKFYIKRLIGLGGQELEIREPWIYINGKRPDQISGISRVSSAAGGYSGYTYPVGGRYLRSPGDKYVIPDQHFFVLGDNTRNSLDGRYWGSVPENDLVGRAIIVYWPLSRRVGLVK